MCEARYPHPSEQVRRGPILRGFIAKNGATGVYCFRICRYALGGSACLGFRFVIPKEHIEPVLRERSGLQGLLDRLA